MEEQRNLFELFLLLDTCLPEVDFDCYIEMVSFRDL